MSEWLSMGLYIEIGVLKKVCIRIQTDTISAVSRKVKKDIVEVPVENVGTSDCNATFLLSG